VIIDHGTYKPKVKRPWIFEKIAANNQALDVWKYQTVIIGFRTTFMAHIYLFGRKHVYPVPLNKGMLPWYSLFSRYQTYRIIPPNALGLSQIT
jgi:hypothetical protein